MEGEGSHGKRTSSLCKVSFSFDESEEETTISATENVKFEFIRRFEIQDADEVNAVALSFADRR